MDNSKPPMRFAIWTAVSSESQAGADKVSLSEQESWCRAAGEARSWRETAGPFVAPGESRTRWVNLRDAEEAIPALHAMLDSAQRGEFEVLLLYAYDRLRELLDPVARTLSAYNVQLYSVSQPVEPMPAADFDPYTTDTANAVQFVSALTSRAQINSIRRAYRLGVPARVRDRGLHAVGPLPFGYRKPPGRELDRNAVPIQDPEKAALVLQAKDLLLSGQSVPQVTAWLNTTGIRPRRGGRWNVGTVRKMLTNPYYAGVVQHGAIRRRRDPRTGKFKDTIVKDRSRILEGKGAHEPLWDEATLHAILAQYARRARTFKGRKTHRLSRLLFCGLCSQPLHLIYFSGIGDDVHRAWYCRAVPDRWHNFIRDADALQRLAVTLVADLHTLGGLPLPEREDRSTLYRAALSDLLTRRDRLTDALEAGSLDPVTYAERVKGIEARLAAARFELETAERAAERSATRSEMMKELTGMIEDVPGFLLKAPAQAVNAQLSKLIEKIVVGETGTLQIFYR